MFEVWMAIRYSGSQHLDGLEDYDERIVDDIETKDQADRWLNVLTGLYASNHTYSFFIKELV